MQLNLKKWHRENRAALFELTIIILLAGLLYWASARYDLADSLYRWVLDFMEIGDLALVCFFLTLALSIFSVRRWRELKERIRLADTDGLTGLFNKRRFRELLEHEISRSHRHHRPLSLILFDIDYFKQINDQYGHEVGDEVLKEVAKIINEKLRDLDYIARWGGDEFAIIATETPLQGAAQLSNRLRLILASHNFERVGPVTASFGVGQFHPMESAQQWIRRVDSLLYAAKKSGRNMVQSRPLAEAVEMLSTLEP